MRHNKNLTALKVYEMTSPRAIQEVVVQYPNVVVVDKRPQNDWAVDFNWKLKFVKLLLEQMIASLALQPNDPAAAETVGRILNSVIKVILRDIPTQQADSFKTGILSYIADTAQHVQQSPVVQTNFPTLAGQLDRALGKCRTLLLFKPRVSPRRNPPVEYIDPVVESLVSQFNSFKPF
jgi:hypothetical protein